MTCDVMLISFPNIVSIEAVVSASDDMVVLATNVLITKVPDCISSI